MKRARAPIVLIIHDSPERLHEIAHPLRKVGYQVLTAPDSQAGLEMARREHPDLLISDECRPGVNGIELCRSFRREASFRATPLLLIKSGSPDAARGLEDEAEADDYLASPLDPLLLIAKVTRLLERKRGEEAGRQEMKLVGLLRDVASAANQAASMHEAVLMCFDQLCVLTQCQVGHLYLTSAQDERELLPTSFWHTADPARFKKFMKATEATQIAVGGGLVGKAFVTGQPMWSLDLPHDPNFLRAKPASEVGLRTGFAFPILIAAEVVGVLEFFSCEVVPPDASLLEMMASVGVQLGRVVGRERAEKVLEESVNKYRLLMEQASDGIVISTATGSYLTLVNSRACDMLGYHREECLGLELKDLFLPEDLAVTPLRFREIEAGRTVLAERCLRRKDGTVFTAELSTRKLEDRIQVIFRDITTRKIAEDALQQSEEKYRSLIANIPDVTWTADSHGHTTFISPNVEKVFGFSAEEICREGETLWLGRIHPDDRARVRDTYHSLFTGDGAFDVEYRVQRKDGVWIWIQDRAVATYEKDGARSADGVFSDITDRKRAEEGHLILSNHIRLLLQSTGEGIYGLDLEGLCTFINKSGLEMIGYRPNEVVGENMHELIHHSRNDGSPYPIAECQVYNAFHQGQHCRVNSEVLWRRDGTSFAVEYSSHPIIEGGVIKGAVVTFSNITERKLAEEALRESEERFRIAMEAAQMGTWDFDLLTGRAKCSDTHTRMLGGEQAQFDGSFEAFLHCVHPEDRAFVKQKIARDIERRANHEMEFRVVWPDGSVHWLNGNGQVLCDQTGRAVRLVGVSRDITEHKLLEGQLRQAHKLESIGQLAAGIAHEINTPTQYVGDNTHFLQDAFGDLTQLLQKYEQLLDACRVGHPPPALVAEVESLSAQFDLPYLSAEIPKAIQQSLEGISRVTKIVQSMKDFAHPSSAEKQAGDLNKAIESTITVARNEWKYVAEMVTDFAPDLPLVPCLLSEFNQVILNMIVNATHAISDVVGKGEQDKGQITITTQREGDWAVISIADTGTGIPEKIRDKVFDPFFTTKQVGKGTGQGLAISHMVIVEKHGGSLSFKTEEGRGTTFFIRLPMTEERLTPDRKKPVEVRVSTGA